MTHSESLNELAGALAKAQAVMRGAPRDAHNPHFGSRFSSLASVWDACREALTANGLCVLQPARAEQNQVTVTTFLLHSSGQWISSPLTMTARDASPQSIGSALTYARRYGLQAAVGICAEDDDGEAATDRHAPAQSQAPAPVAPREARPVAVHRPNGNGHGHGADEPRKFDTPPRSGKALYAWTRGKEQEHEVELLKYLNKWGKLQDFPGRMVDWDADQVERAHAEAVRKLQGQGDGDAPEEAHRREPGEEG